MSRHFITILAVIALSASCLTAQSAYLDVKQLLGTWQLDMSPEDPSDSNFAYMEITAVDNNRLEGFFYREGVKIKDGRINTQAGTIVAALVSGDNSGSYNTSFYMEDGKLYGSTHAIDRGFLAVWVATKEKVE